MKIRSIKFLKKIFPLAIAIVINGCAWQALKEINYQGQLPVDANLALTEQFANDLAAEAGLKITDVIPQTNLKPGAWNDVSLRRQHDGTPRVGVLISTSAPKNIFQIQITGDIESPEALAIAQKAVELFKKKYPGSNIEPFTRHAGPLGP